VSSGGDLYGGGELTETFVGLKNFARAVENEAFWVGMARVVGYAAFQIPVMILSALVLALLLDSFIVRRPGLFRLSFFLPYAIPGVIAAMMWLYLYTPEVSPFLPYLPDSVNLMAPSTVLASMANMTTWTYTGYNMLIFLAALQAIPHDLYEAAQIDGASGIQVATKIKIPLVRGAALLAVLLSIIGTIQLFNEPTIMASANPWMGRDYTPMMLTYSSRLRELAMQRAHAPGEREPLDVPGLHPDDANLPFADGRDLSFRLRPRIRLLAAAAGHLRLARSGVRARATSKGRLMTAVKPSSLS